MRVLRFTNADVPCNLDGMLMTIGYALQDPDPSRLTDRPLTPILSPPGGAGERG